MKKTKFWIVFAVFALLQVLTGAALAAPSAQKITSETGIASGTAVIGEASGGIKPADIGGAWETMAPMPEGRVFNAVIANGNYVYVIGGTSDAISGFQSVFGQYFYQNSCLLRFSKNYFIYDNKI